MKGKCLAITFILGFMILMLAACGVQPPIDIDKILSQEKAFVGSDNCKMCHLEHYDSWKMTMHSRMTQDAQKNRDAIIVPIDEPG
jgi:cytochrome c1